ncbi:cyclic peptide export ABC transporter [Clostridium botulinum]|nr:cyclic peptide export ABC transporter [Clostridium botulinum]MCS4475411.1 cyclic peptide export ABC transporter [Clostridium botulinum]
MIKALREIFIKQRYFKFNGIKSSLRFIFSFLFMLGLSYCIYLMPQVLYDGVSWKFAFVWLPNSVEMALYSVYVAIWLIYVYLIFTSFLKRKNKEILVLSLLSVLSGFGNALIIFTINIAMNSNNALKFTLLIYFILGIVLYGYGQKIMREKLIDFTNEIVYSKRMKIVNKLLGAHYSKFEQIEKGRIQSTLNNDTETISRFVNILIGGITSAVTLICCFIYLGTINIYALLLSALIIVLIASIYYLVGRYANKLGEDARDLQNVFFKFINDLIGGFKELSLNENRKNEFQKDIEESCDKYKVKRNKSALAFANMFVIGELLFTLAIGSVVFIFPLVLKELDSTSLTSYVFVLLYMTGPVHGILNTIPNAIEVKISLKRINSLIDEISSYNKEEGNTIDKNIRGSLSLKLQDVEYEYAKTDGESFKVGPINYEFKSGEIVFITGGNGSGKSTLAKLLTGLYSPTKGDISLNDRISQKLLNQSYSTVFADFYLFDKLYGINYKGKEIEIQRYLEILQLNDKVQIQDGKFSTTKLSTGQKKRLALLVTYLEDRPIYLFDEWSADQDPEFRLFFYDTLLPELKAKGKCVIAVTHDDRYFNLADRVIKMDLGKISNLEMR